MFRHLPAYVISCKDDKERREITKKRFEEKNLPFTFFDASDGYVLSPEVFEKENIQHPHPGARGVSLSHKRLWRKMVEENIPYMVIYEDDVIFHPQFNYFAQIMWEETQSLSKGEDFIAFMGYCCFHHMNGNQRVSKPQVVENFPMALHGYIISQGVARWFLENYGTVKENIDIHLQKLFYEKQPSFKSYVWWNGAYTIPEQQSSKFNVFFNGFCYQDHNIQLSIHRNKD